MTASREARDARQDQSLTSDPMSERALLGSIIINPDCMDDVRSVLGDSGGMHFTDDARATIYDVMVSIRADGEPLDAVTLGHRLIRSGLMERAGGMSHISELSGVVKTSSYARDYAVAVRDMTLRRAIQEMLRGAYRATRQSGEPAPAIAAQMVERIERIMCVGDGADFVRLSDTVQSVGERMMRMHERGRESFGVSTGIGNLDGLLLGLEPGSVTVIACRPGVGKSTISLQMAAHVAERHGHAAIVSLEMSREQLEDKAAFMLGAISRREVINRYIARDALESKLAAFASSACLSRLWILDYPAITAGELRIRLKRFHERHSLAIAVIDYLQLLRPQHAAAGRYEQVSEMSRTIKLLAREMNVPILLLSQLNREGAERPRLHNLRESGAIEQDADNVILMWPDGDDGTIMVDVAKHRTGATGMCALFFRRDTQRFYDADMPKRPQRRRGGAPGRGLNGSIVSMRADACDYDFSEPEEECPF